MVENLKKPADGDVHKQQQPNHRQQRSPPNQPPTGGQPPNAGHSGNQPPKRWYRSSKFWDRLGAVSSAVCSLLLVWVGFRQTGIFSGQKEIMDKQTKIMDYQFETSKLDERPWTAFIADPAAPNGGFEIEEPQGGVPSIKFLGILTNSGKTPALEVSFKMRIEILGAKQETRLEYPRAVGTYIVDTGAIFPNSPQITQPEWPISRDEVDRLKTGEDYAVFYNEGAYTDAFGDQHWTHYCVWHSWKGAASAHTCVAYNRIDVAKYE